VPITRTKITKGNPNLTLTMANADPYQSRDLGGLVLRLKKSLPGGGESNDPQQAISRKKYILIDADK